MISNDATNGYIGIQDNGNLCSTMFCKGSGEAVSPFSVHCMCSVQFKPLNALLA